MPSSGMLRCVTHVRTDASEQTIDAVIGVKGISELGTTLAVTNSYHSDNGGDTFVRNFSSYNSYMLPHPIRWNFA
jgi:hypothetical protein